MCIHVRNFEPIFIYHQSFEKKNIRINNTPRHSSDMKQFVCDKNRVQLPKYAAVSQYHGAVGIYTCILVHILRWLFKERAKEPLLYVIIIRLMAHT